ncbi:MAG: DUF169 domain-containing protein [Candidatus Omnitrophica bacterium]|nr:DUF169 domain-containing protein [Candidatus Omnitrophota bacterium]
MSNTNWELSDKFGGHWIKVKFYKEKPDLKEAKQIKDARFCEAVQQALISPILLDRKSISCLGAQYAFGWNDNPDLKDKLIEDCLQKRQISTVNINNIIEKTFCLKEPFDYIGLNTEGKPDLVISYLQPGEVMRIIKLYNNNGQNLNISCATMMAICGDVAVKSFLTGDISFSFGCDDSREYGKIGRDRMAVGIPSNLFNLFV